MDAASTPEERPAPRVLILSDGGADSRVTIVIENAAWGGDHAVDQSVTVTYALFRFGHPDFPYWAISSWQAQECQHQEKLPAPSTGQPVRLPIDAFRVDPGPHQLRWRIDDGPENAVDFDWPTVPGIVTTVVTTLAPAKPKEAPPTLPPRHWRVAAAIAVAIGVGIAGLAHAWRSPQSTENAEIKAVTAPPQPVDGCIAKATEINMLKKNATRLLVDRDRAGAARLVALMADRCPEEYAIHAAELFSETPQNLQYGQGDADCAQYYRSLADKKAADRKTCRYSNDTTLRN